MKIQIRPRDITLTPAQRVRLEHDLGLALARFGERIDRVIVAVSGAKDAGGTCCEIEVRMKPEVLTVEHSDPDVFVAVDHAARRAARSVRRAFDTALLVGR